MTGTTGVVSISDVLTTVDCTIVSSNASIQGRTAYIVEDGRRAHSMNRGDWRSSAGRWGRRSCAGLLSRTTIFA